MSWEWCVGPDAQRFSLHAARQVCLGAVQKELALAVAFPDVTLKDADNNPLKPEHV